MSVSVFLRRSTLMIIIHKVQLHELPSNENGDINYQSKFCPLITARFRQKTSDSARVLNLRKSLISGWRTRSCRFRIWRWRYVVLIGSHNTNPLATTPCILLSLRHAGLVCQERFCFSVTFTRFQRYCEKCRVFFYNEFYRRTVKRVYHSCAGQLTFEWVNF